MSAIIAAGGRGSRFGADGPKQLLALAGRSILERSVEAFVQSPRITDIVVALPEDVLADLPVYLRNRSKPIDVVEGGACRQDSVARACARVFERADIVVVHDAARPLVSEALIGRVVDVAVSDGAAIAAVPVRDTLKRGDASGLVTATVSREGLYSAQTPQAFRVGVLRDALALPGALQGDATDESMLAERAGHPVRIVEGETRNLKITTPDDLRTAERLLNNESSATSLRIGNGYDLHRLVAGRPLILGGVRIPFDKGLQGHSDADAVCHAVTDAILGAAAAGDIGRHFPDSDPRWKDADSLALLAHAAGIIRGTGYAVINVDVVVIAERPKVLPHVETMRENLARALGVHVGQVGVKGKTNEGVDAIGAGEAIAVHAVALLHNMTATSGLA